MLEESKARLAEVRLPEPFDLEAFRRDMEVMSGRRIVLQPLDGIQGVGLIGVRISTIASDHVFYPALASRPHQTHVVLRGLIHTALLQASEGIDNAEMQKLMPDLAPRVVRDALQIEQRPTSEKMSHEADLLATLLGEQIARSELSRFYTPLKAVEEITPLWQSLVTPAPNAIVHQLDTPELQLYRQVIEINEEELRLLSHGHPQIDSLASIAARRHGFSTEDAHAFVEAAQLEAARRARKNRCAPLKKIRHAPAWGSVYSSEVQRLRHIACMCRSKELNELVDRVC
ncbi:DUF6545 domain-containing protein [Streptomyces sparsogenes]|uniref:DUF6545 domain-containing protein n=1 Tax=Streptomyces sparsogenes TaxID=67365 RepID=UPI00384F6EF0